jgi:hypothetical protein
MGEMGIDNRILAALKSNLIKQDAELIRRLEAGTFYKYKKILQRKGII